MGALSALKHKAPAKYGNELICQLQSLQIPVCMYVPHTHTHWERNKLFIYANILNCKIVCGQIVLQPASFFCCPRTHTQIHTRTHIHTQLHTCTACIFVWFHFSLAATKQSRLWLSCGFIYCCCHAPPLPSPLCCCVFNLMFINLALPVPTQ